MTNEATKRELPSLSAEEVLRRMLNTPPKPHTKMVKKKAKQPSKKK